MAKLGLPVSILIAIAVKFIADDIEKKALYLKKRAKDADRGADAEEVVAEKLRNLPK